MDTLLFVRPPAAPAAQTVGATPWVYSNTSAGLQQVIVSGGVVTLIELNVGVGYVPFPALFGTIPIFPGQSVRISYLVTPPTVSMVQL